VELAGEGIKTYAMDHHGLVAGICKDIRIAEKIDKRIAKIDTRRLVNTRIAVVAMILNGFGFTNRRLYLTPQFFESKPIERLSGVPKTIKQAREQRLKGQAERLFGRNEETTTKQLDFI
jgi:transposase